MLSSVLESEVVRCLIPLVGKELRYIRLRNLIALVTASIIGLIGLTCGGGQAQAGPMPSQSQSHTQEENSHGLTVLAASATGESATLSVVDGAVSRSGESVRILRGGVETKLPDVITVDVIQYDVTYDILDAHTFTLSAAAAEQATVTNDRSLRSNWGGSWDQCVSGAAVKGGLTSGIVTFLLSGPAAAVTAAAGMIGSGVVSMLSECWGKPFTQP